MSERPEKFDPTTVTIPAWYRPIFTVVGAVLGLVLAFLVGPLVGWLVDQFGEAPLILRALDQLSLAWVLPILVAFGGIAGFVIDGAVRDADALAELGLPVFARGVTPACPYKNGPGRLNEPVALGGVVVSPGDLIVADADGVVVVKSADVDDVIVAAEEVVAREASKRASFSS